MQDVELAILKSCADCATKLLAAGFLIGPLGTGAAVGAALFGVVAGGFVLLRGLHKRHVKLTGDQTRVLQVLVLVNRGLLSDEVVRILRSIGANAASESIDRTLESLRNIAQSDGKSAALVAVDHDGRWRAAGL